VDALPPLPLDARSLGGCFATSALSLHRQSLHCCILFSAGSVDRSRVVEVVALYFSFSCLYVYSRSLTTCYVVCNLCYEGSLVVVSCNSLCLMKNGLYSSIAKKISQRDIKPWFKKRGHEWSF
jgi:hypothetical protein